ncbi:hypothetical protein PT7_P019 (plasmid) [Pusillimonas sp. T7-7]|uniref:hypothetical protein n=1 Tax=Pusillimonas sp. (strain T7-7) TaxID=1007105 RepID=UPI0002084A8A|nr:hypothetical protein [Pusillimonas sp. T7-7]AEC22255.1 hypothetical protein PT7_P019 [Pusillimonas sp. T7-7]
MDRFSDLRAALDAVPCVKWTASRATVHIPETEDWAGKDLCITGLDKQVARKLARYIADTHPVAIRSLLAERDALREALEAMMEYAGQPITHPAARLARAALAQEQGGSDDNQS